MLTYHFDDCDWFLLPNTMTSVLSLEIIEWIEIEIVQNAGISSCQVQTWLRKSQQQLVVRMREYC